MDNTEEKNAQSCTPDEACRCDTDEQSPNEDKMDKSFADLVEKLREVANDMEKDLNELPKPASYMMCSIAAMSAHAKIGLVLEDLLKLAKEKKDEANPSVSVHVVNIG